jgi:hypothetical protein
MDERWPVGRGALAPATGEGRIGGSAAVADHVEVLVG